MYIADTLYSTSMEYVNVNGVYINTHITCALHAYNISTCIYIPTYGVRRTVYGVQCTPTRTSLHPGTGLTRIT